MTMLRGIVHDPTARRMGGVAGHAGLFSTAADLAIFCRMLLERRRARRRPHPVAAGGREDDERRRRRISSRTRAALGWDIDSSFSSNRGELLPIGSFGHTGFTGTSIWIDPATEMFVVFLSNRVHPDGKGDVTPLRARVATVAATAVTSVPPTARAAAWTGRDFGAVAARVTPRPPAPVAERRSTCCAPTASRRCAASASAWSPITPASPATARRRSTCCSRREGREARRALQPRARHPRHARREGRVGEGREDRAADSLALRRDAPADGRDARRARHARHRPPGHRRALLHLHRRPWRTCWRRRRSGGCRSSCSIGRTRSTASRSKGRRSTRRMSASRGYFRRCRSVTGLTMGELARLFNGENKIGADLTVDRGQELGARRLVRRDRRCRGSTRRRTCAT